MDQVQLSLNLEDPPLPRVTRMIPARAGAYTELKSDQQGASVRMVPMSLPRVRWLERPEIGEPVDAARSRD